MKPTKSDDLSCLLDFCDDNEATVNVVFKNQSVSLRLVEVISDSSRGAGLLNERNTTSPLTDTP
jgi:hypothetical protein